MRRLLLALLVIAACDGASSLTAPDLSFSVVSGDGQSGTVGQPLANPLVVKATDSKGKAIRNLAIEFRVTSGGGSASPATANTNSQGVAQTSWRLGTSAAELQQLEARAVSTGQVFGVFTATALAGPPASMVMNSADSQTTTRLTAVPVPPAVRITDQYGNPVSGKSVTFAIPFYDEGGNVTGNPAVSNAAGIATLGSWVVGPAVGRHWVHVSIPELAYVIVTFTAVATLENGARMALQAGNNQVAQVGTLVPVHPAVRITDASSAPIAGVQPTWQFVQGGGSFVNSQATDANGVATLGDWRLCCTPGTYRLRVTVQGSPDTVFVTATGTAANPHSIAVQAGNAQSAITDAAVAIAPAAVVRDSFGNPAPGVAVDFVVTAGGGSVSGSPATTDANGIATLGSWRLGSAPGSNALSATVSGVAGAATFTATGVAPVAAASKSTVSVSPITIVASTGAITSTITVTARDTNSNPVPGLPVTLTVSGTGNAVTQPTTVTDANGITTGAVSSTVAGQKTVSATIDGVTLAATRVVTVKGAAPRSGVIIAGNNQTAVTGTQVPINPTIVVRDEWGNPSPGYNVPLSVYGGTICCSTVSDDTGVISVSWTLGSQPGPQTLVAGPLFETGYLYVSATAVTSAASLQVVSGNGQTGPANAPLPNPLVVRAVSAAGDPVANAFVDFYVIRGDGSFTLPPGVQAPQRTGSDGQATVASWTLGPYSGTQLLEARVTGTDTTVLLTATGTGSAWMRHADVQYRFALGAAEANGTLYAVGGFGCCGYPFEKGTLEAYDLATDTWTERAPMPTPRFGVGVATINGRMYVVGGEQDVYMLGTLEVYDPTTNTWTTKAPMPTPRSFMGVAVVDGILYAIGGAACADANIPCQTHSVATVEAYDPVTDTWTTRAAMPTARRSVGAATANGRIYAVGGAQSDRPWNETPSIIFSTNEEYDPATDSWMTKAPMPTSRYGASVATLNGAIHAIGGDRGGPLAGTHEEFDPAANVWTTRQAMPTPRFWSGVAVVAGRIFVVGGNGAFTAVESYQP